MTKIHKRLSDAPGRPVISNCGRHTEKVSEYLNHILKIIMPESWFCVKDSGDFLEKIESIGKIPEGAVLVTADVVGLYPSIPHGVGLEGLRKRVNERETPRVPFEELIKMADFVLKNKFFEFNGEVKRQKSGTTIGTNPCICLHFYECSRKRIPYKPVFTTSFMAPLY